MRKLTVLLLFMNLPFGLFADEPVPVLLVTIGGQEALSEYGDSSIQLFSELLLGHNLSVISRKKIMESAESVPSSSFLPSARQDAIVFLVVNHLRMDNDIISIQTEFYYTPDGALLFRTEASGSRNLGLENKLRFIAAQAAMIASTEIDTRGRATVEKDWEMLVESGSSPPREDMVSDVPPAPGPDGVVEDKPAAESRPSWSVGLGGAVTIPLGRSADYHAIGGDVHSDFGCRVSSGSILTMLGMRTGFTWFSASGSSRDSQDYLFYAGPAILLAPNSFRKATPELTLMGGIGFLGVGDSGSGWMWKALPWFGMSAGLGIAVSERILVSGSLEYHIYVEESLTFLFLNPSLGVRYQW